MRLPDSNHINDSMCTVFEHVEKSYKGACKNLLKELRAYILHVEAEEGC